MDLLTDLRRRNFFDPNNQPYVSPRIDTTGLFDGSGDISPAVNLPTNNPLDVPDSNLAALRGRARPYMDRLKAFYESEPSRKDYQLSKVGKALAAASGIIDAGVNKNTGRGIGIAKQLMDEPYETAKSDWASKGGRLGQLANIEDTQLKDQQALEVKIAEDEAKKRDDLRQMITVQSGVKMNEAQIKKIEDDIKNGKLTIGLDKLSGQRQIIDPKTRQVWNIGKIEETPGETSKREFADFKKKFDVEQAGRVYIKGMDQAQDQLMLSLKQTGDKDLARLKSNLDNLSPTQRNAAFDGAYKQTLLMQPTMKALLFDEKDGELTLKEKYNPDVFQLFNESVKERMNTLMGAPSTGFKSGEVGRMQGDSTTPIDTNAPVIDPARKAQAVAWLTQQGFATDDNNIAEWIRQDDADKGSGTPSVALPEASTPVVTTPDVGLEAIKSLPGIISRNVSFGEQPRNPPNVQLTDPNTDVGLDALRGYINSIRNTPQNIYDPQGLAMRRNRR